MKKSMIYIIIAIIVLVFFSFTLIGSQKMKYPAKEYFSDPATISLAEAAARGDETSITEAIASGGDVNAIGKTEITPLLYVLSETQNYTGIIALLKAGANPNYMTTKGIGPLTLVAQGNDPELLRIMLDHGNGNPNLITVENEPVAFPAISQKRWDNLEILLDHGANVNGKDDSGYTLLMTLAIQGEFEQVEKLIKRGALVDTVTIHNRTFAHIVAEYSLSLTASEQNSRQRIVDLLKAKGISVEPQKFPN